MKKILRRTAAALMCLLVLFAAAPAAQGASVYFMAVNDTLLELSDANMPTTVGGVLYVPYTMLASNVTGVNLGVYATYSSVKNRVLVHSNRKQLIFDLQEDLTYDMDGRSYTERAIVRNSTVYIPIARVCDVFREINYSLNSTEFGYLVRIKNAAVVLGDDAFINAAANMMSSSLVRYQQEHPDPGSVPRPTPVPGVGSGAGVYLAFTLTEDGTLDSVLSALAEEGGTGMFFLTGEQLLRQDDLVRELVGRGHFIGLRVLARTGQEAEQELEQMERLLALAAHCRADVVLTEELDEEGAARLEQAGYLCWRTTADGRGQEGSGYARASALMRQMTGGEEARNYLLLDDLAGDTLAAVLSYFGREDYQLRAPVAPEL